MLNFPNNTNMEVLITANSPGEIAGWTRPVVKCLLEKEPSVKISVLLLPCSFSSGREREVAESIPGVQKVYSVWETISIILFGGGDRFGRSKVLLHLGGDLFYAALLSHRLDMPAWAYEWAQKGRDKHFKGYFARDEKNRQTLLKRDIDDNKIHIVGDLLVDSVYLRADDARPVPKREGMLIGLMPGSRTREALGLMPLLGGVADNISERFPDTDFYMPISPFIDREKFFGSFPLKPDKKMPGVVIEYSDVILRTEKGTPIYLSDDSMSVMKQADFIITIPGTTTGEAGTLGIPLLSILPLNRPELIPYIGLIGLLEHVPLIGKPLKAKLMMSLSKTKPLLSQPNLRAGKEVIPEIMEVVNPDIVFEKILPYLENKEKLAQIREDLLNLYSPYRGAAKQIAEMILKRR